jgi:hypothetical protein
MFDSIKSFASGFVGQAWDTVKGVGEVIAHPIDTIEGVAYAATHPVDTYNGIKAQVGQAFSDDPANASGRAAFEVVSLFTPAALTKVATAAKAAKAARVAGEVGKGAKLADAAGDAGKAARIAEAGAEAGKGARVAEAGAEAGKGARVAEAGADAGKGDKAASAARLSQDVAKGIDRLPTSAADDFGHWKSKHGPKDARQAAEAQARLKPTDSVTWFDDEAKMTKALEKAPEGLKDVLARDPQKLKEFEEFLANPKEKGAFWFSYKVPGETSLGPGIAGDGTRLVNDGTAFVRYQYAKGEGGKLVPKVKTAFPVGTE